jgi:hypothetical protein
MGLFSRKDQSVPEGDTAAAPTSGTATGPLPIPGYDRLNSGEITGRLHQLSQVELSAIEEHERGHESRQPVLSKLGYLMRSEPVPGYDAMAPEEITGILDKSDAQQVKAVRDYERKFQGRREVLDEASRVLPEAPASAAETRSRDEKVARVRGAMRRAPGGGR